MEWLLFIVGIMADGSVRAEALDTFTERPACMARAREVNAMPDRRDVRWSNTGCIQIPARDQVERQQVPPTGGQRL